MQGRLDNTACSRRAFVKKGAISAAALATIGLNFGGCSSSSLSDTPDVLTVSDNQVVTLDAFTQIEDTEGYCTVEEIAELDAGSTLYASGATIAAMLCTGKTASPLSYGRLFNMANQKANTVLAQAMGQDDDFNVHSMRASDSLLVWTESNYLTSEWRVYAASIDASTLSIGPAMQLDAGDAQYDVPEIAAIDSTAYWIVQPAEDGDKTSEDSLLKAAAGGSLASVLFTSHGRFNGGLSTSGQVLTAMPRAESSSSVYYQLTAFQNGTGAVIASQVMPRSFKPSCAIYMGNAFAFAIGAAYDYGGGIANVGTYYPLDTGEYVRLARTPVTAPGLCRGWLFCKSGSRTAFINCNERTYLVIDAPDSCEDHGDYSIALGEVDTVCNYATLTRTVDGKDSKSLLVRRLTPTTI